MKHSRRCLVQRYASKYGKQKYQIHRMSLQRNCLPVILEFDPDYNCVAVEFTDGTAMSVDVLPAVTTRTSVRCSTISTNSASPTTPS